MVGVPKVKAFERRITPIERFFTHSPFSIVTLVARLRGDVTESGLREAVSKVRQRHTNLRVRIREDADGQPWFTTGGAGEIPVEVVPRESEDHWIRVVQESSRVPFEFETRPPIRFILVQSPEVSELVIMCHHIICDGLSMAYLARDVMVHLGDPTREVEVLPDPVPIDRDNIPKDVSINAVARFLINRMNKNWAKERILFDQEDYRTLTEAYWANFEHQILSVELSEPETTALVDRCRRNGVTVNTALSAAFVGAQVMVRGRGPRPSSVGTAASLRDRIGTPVGEVMGFYAGVATLTHDYDGKRSFWENAREFHEKMTPLFTNKNLFNDYLTWCYLDPSIMEAVNFKKLGGLIPRETSRYEKISAFSAREDVVSSLLKRGKMDSLETTFIGTAVTNLTRLDFPREYGPLELDRLILKAGGAFPLVNIDLLLAAVTCAGKLSLLMEFAEQATDVATMEKIKEEAMGFLRGE